VTGDCLSAVLLDLHRYSRELTLGEFQGLALQRLQQDLRFDSAWWGVAHSSHDIHGSLPYNLPADYADFYLEHVSDTDSLAEAALASPARTVYFGPADFAASPGLSLLTRHFGIQQALCCVLNTPILNLSMFISLYRTSAEPRYLACEMDFCDWVAPHLWATWTTNWIAQMEHIRVNNAASRVAHAICDQRDILHSAEPRFVDLLHAEWPDWHGPSLPAALRVGRLGDDGYRGRAISLRTFNTCGLMLMEARLNSALDTLSPREKTIAEAFSEGRSYKQIAGQLGLSPATVRHHLRNIYTKTNVSNKSALTGLLK
jgi:DNA-binding CsgD family transcriptional regulator